MLSKKIFLLLISIILIVIISQLLPKKIETEEVKPIMPEFKLKTVGWIPYWDQEKALSSFYNNVSLFDYIGLFWYRLDPSGNIKTYKETKEDLKIIDFAHQNNVRALFLIANLPDFEEGGSWDYKRVELVISDSQKRQEHISVIINMLEALNFDGVVIDYEALKGFQRENFSLFIEELGTIIHQKGKILGVAIHPKTGENDKDEENGSEAQDIIKLSKSADQLYFMTYTEHSLSSSPGPSGSINWINQVLSFALDELKIPPRKIYFGIGLFGLEWQKKDGSFNGVNDDLTFTQIQEILSENNIQTQWDSKSKTSYFEYEKNNKKHIVWFENFQSVEERLKLAYNLSLGGVAFWRLGGEDQAIWYNSPL